MDNPPATARGGRFPLVVKTDAGKASLPIVAVAVDVIPGPGPRRPDRERTDALPHGSFPLGKGPWSGVCPPGWIEANVGFSSGSAFPNCHRTGEETPASALTSKVCGRGVFLCPGRH
jgi:hypothetical protein